ncbi:rod-binding protein [Sphingomonas sp.]|uniref:rod-binding protein n=1 Tax=Sphingomonas sp. TaxID=28214 RepID=UPI002E35114A|nr:rod-binding protein [Sphingomonas sp.]HEX4694571.1 rod-binding protein [Sphingomonas sp.]
MTDFPSSTGPTPIAPTTGISTDTSRLGSAANLKKAGEQFESVFIGLMMKSMRQAKLGDGLFDSKEQDTFREMQDKQIAESMAAHQPIGIGKAMTDFLSRSQASLQTPAAAPAADEASTTP